MPDCWFIGLCPSEDWSTLFSITTTAAAAKITTLSYKLMRLWWKGRWRQSVRRDPRPQRKWGSRSFPRIILAVGLFPWRRRRRQCRSRNRPPAPTSPQPDRLPGGGNRWKKKQRSAQWKRMSELQTISVAETCHLKHSHTCDTQKYGWIWRVEFDRYFDWNKLEQHGTFTKWFQYPSTQLWHRNSIPNWALGPSKVQKFARQIQS